MNHIKTAFAVFGISILLNACIYHSSTFLEPSAENGVVKQAKPACGGPPNSILFTAVNQELIRIQIFTSFVDDRGKTKLFLSIEKNPYMPLFPNEKERAKFTEGWNQEVKISSKESVIAVKWNEEINYLPFSLSSEINYPSYVNNSPIIFSLASPESDSQGLPINAKENLVSMQWNSEANNLPLPPPSNVGNTVNLIKNSVFLFWTLPDIARKGFTLKIPPLEIDGVTLEIPEIIFTPKTQNDTYAINC